MGFIAQMALPFSNALDGPREVVRSEASLKQDGSTACKKVYVPLSSGIEEQ